MDVCRSTDGRCSWYSSRLYSKLARLARLIELLCHGRSSAFPPGEEGGKRKPEYLETPDKQVSHTESDSRWDLNPWPFTAVFYPLHYLLPHLAVQTTHVFVASACSALLVMWSRVQDNSEHGWRHNNGSLHVQREQAIKPRGYSWQEKSGSTKQ